MNLKYRICNGKNALLILLFVLSITSCKKLVEIDGPITSVNEANVYDNDATAIAVMTGIYTRISKNGSFTGNTSISLFSGLSADELTLFNGVTQARYIAYYSNSLIANATQTFGDDQWVPLYNAIFNCNSAIEGLNRSTSLTLSVKQQLLGEAKFMRAFFYFYMYNLFGDVPLTVSTDPLTNAVLARAPKDQIYQQIIKDLKEAQVLLSTEYLNGNLQPYSGAKERVRPTKWAATALLARAYLYIGDFTNAELESNSIISNSSLFSLTSLNDVFKKNSNETIWQLQPVTGGHNTEDGWTFILPPSGPTDINGGYPVYLSTQLLNSFEAGDQRSSIGNWVNKVTTSGGNTYYYAYKYKSATLNAPLAEYLMVLRLAEQYLIRAEARAQQNNIIGAQNDLNTIRVRAGLPVSVAADKTSLLSAILHERQVELFCEIGHRWFDLKRTNTINQVMALVTPLKGGTWESKDQLYPIPFSEILNNPNLVQNSGY